MLSLDHVDAFYGAVQVLRDVSFTLEHGDILCLLGRNGAGKTTTLKAIMGLVPVTSGRIVFDGCELNRLRCEAIPRLGIGYVPQGRRLFSELTVRENLEIGLMTRRTGRAALDAALSFFPVLADRFRQRAGSLSGGEQQMLAIARALCLEPRLLLLDEPTEGLSPAMIERIRAAILELRGRDVTTILVEQRVDAVLPVATRVAFVENGRVRSIVPVEALAADRGLVDHYVGLG